MNHRDFLAGYSNGTLDLLVHKANANYLMNSPFMPKNEKAAIAFWRLIMFLCFPIGIYIIFAKSIWIGLAIIFFSFMIAAASQKSAAQAVYKRCLENEFLFGEALASGAIRIVQKNN